MIGGIASIAMFALASTSFGDTRWSNLNGMMVNPLHLSSGKAAVLFFVATDCPISNQYSPEINRIIAIYKAKKVTFFIVYDDDGATAAKVKKHAHEYGYSCDLILDPKHTLASRSNATVTPEVVIVGAHDQIFYRGRIDNKYADFNKVRPEPSRRDLRLALDAILSDRNVRPSKTPCIGCQILPPISR
jgi:hypothetical protein